MQKMKTRRAAAKRFTLTGSGEIRRNKAYKSHILEKKSPKRKRNLRKAALPRTVVNEVIREEIAVHIGGLD